MYKKLSAGATTVVAYLITTTTALAQLEAPSGSITRDVQAEDIPQFIVNWVSYIGISLAVIYLMYGGVRWITSGGDKVKVESARKHIIAAVMGLVIVVGTFVLLQILFSILGVEGNPLQDGFTPPKLGE